MNKLHRTVAVLVLALAATGVFDASANAAVINILNMAADDTGTTVSGFTVTGSLTGNTYTFTLTQTGDLDGGAIDDTLTFDLIYESYTGSTFSGGDVTLGAASTPSTANQNWHSSTFIGGDTLSLQVANVFYTDGEGDETVVFNGFTAINPTNYADAPAGDFDFYVGLAGATTITADPTFTADLVTTNGTSPTLYFTAADGPFRLRNLDMQFETTAVPEPSSLMLLGLALSGLTLRRKRA